MIDGFTGRRAFAPLVAFSLLMAGCATAPSNRQTPAPQPETLLQSTPVTALSLASPVALEASPAVVASASAPAARSSVPAAPTVSRAVVYDSGDTLLAASPAPAANEATAIGAEALAAHTVAGLTPEQYPDGFDRMRAGVKL